MNLNEKKWSTEKKKCPATNKNRVEIDGMIFHDLYTYVRTNIQHSKGQKKKNEKEKSLTAKRKKSNQQFIKEALCVRIEINIFEREDELKLMEWVRSRFVVRMGRLVIACWFIKHF